MQKIRVQNTLKKQQEFFAKGQTLNVEFRIESLKKLKDKIKYFQEDIITALYKDLKRSSIESYSAEVAFVYDEIDFVLKNIKKWARNKSVPGSLLTWPSKSEIQFEPFGNTLIIAPWNYPFQLAISPLVGAIAAGNTAIVKPSEIATHTEKITARVINECFSEEYICAITGGVETSQILLDEKFDFIFFTGNSTVGKIILEKAAKNLTPVCLELGGKSPAVVEESANLGVAARRIVWGKFFNAGQTCVAPDFVYVDEKIKIDFISILKKTIREFYGDNESKSENYCKIISKKHFDRLVKIMESEKVIYGGNKNESELFLSPTLLDVNGFNGASMQEEIFGPLLPILSYKTLDESILNLKKQSKPLAFYLFTQNKAIEKRFLKEISFGGGCVNDCLIHLANSSLPFGGVGESGMGSYHGRYSFETFSHKKAILKQSTFFDFNFRYPPYDSKKIKILKKLLK